MNQIKKLGIKILKNRSYIMPCLIALLNVFITYTSIIYFLENNENILYYIALLNIIVFCAFAINIISYIYILRRTSKKTHYGSRFRYRLVLLFTIAAILPVLFMGLFSSITFRNAAKGWFDVKVENAVNNANYVAEAYLKEHNQNIRADIFATNADIERILGNVQSIDVINNHLRTQLLLRDLSAIKIFTQSGQIVSAIFAEDNIADNLKNKFLMLSDIVKIHKENILIKVNTKTYHIHAYKKFVFDKKIYILNITRPINSKAVQYNIQTKKAVSEYNHIKHERRKSEFGFLLIYISFGVLIIICMVKIGQYFALQMTEPLEILTLTAQQIEAGNEAVRCPPPKKIRDEIDRLIVAFNQMIDTLSHEKKLTTAVLKGVSTGVICLDHNYQISLINQRAIDIFKLSKDNIYQLTDLSPSFSDFIDLLKKLEAPKKTQKFNKLYLLKNGDKVHLHFRYAIHDSSVKTIRYIITVDDITELMRIQSTAAWQDIAQRIAHEIKNPLTPISLAVEHINRKWGKQIQKDTAAFKDTLDIILVQVTHILDTANSLSELAKMPTPIFSKINMTMLVKQVILLEALRDPHTSFEFNEDKPFFISGDERLLSQVLINIFKNAIEAIDDSDQKKGVIRIELQEYNDKLRIIITDNGKGLPQDLPQSSLFNPYVTTKETGTGIGLAITGKIISDHDGLISLNNHICSISSKVIGTQVIIELPLEIKISTV